ncbi:MAG: hypothetical protein H0U18_03865 [Pyrinomonadaceae bacterium]|nr:hypothetical protein [Pyrinomonadaceae bacterium]
MVFSAGFAVTWNHVTTTLNGDPLNRTGYEVIITKDVPETRMGSLDPRSTFTFYPRRRV